MRLSLYRLSMNGAILVEEINNLSLLQSIEEQILSRLLAVAIHKPHLLNDVLPLKWSPRQSGRLVSLELVAVANHDLVQRR